MLFTLFLSFLALVPHAPVLLFFEFFLTFWYYKVLQAHPVFSFPRARISDFSEQFSWTMIFRNQDLMEGMLTALEVSLL